MSNSHTFCPSGHQFPVGVGLKAEHMLNVIKTKPDLAFFEVHAENYMTAGGNHMRFLDEVCDSYSLSVHGVGMSLGSAEGIDAQHLKKFEQVVERYKPELVSEHLAWSVHDGHYLNDLLPLPLNESTLAVVADNVSRMQDAVGRKVLIENPSTYVAFKATDIDEPEYLARLAEQTGCGILLDVNNVYVSGRNNGFDAEDYLARIPGEMVGEIHLAGHVVKQVDGAEIRIDDHGSSVIDDVWSLYRHTIERIGARPTLIEWDSNVPELPVLVCEAHKAREQMAFASGVSEAIHGAA